MIGVRRVVRQGVSLARIKCARVDCTVRDGLAPRASSGHAQRRGIMSELWGRCIERLETEFGAEEVQTYLKPLQARESEQGLRLLAPNDYTLEVVRERFLARIRAVIEYQHGSAVAINLGIGTLGTRKEPGRRSTAAAKAAAPATMEHNLDPSYTFETFVEGKTNELGKAAAIQVATNPGRAFNPLLLYGGTGLGKTHLMHAAGNLMRQNNPACKVLYLRSEQFVGSMIDALRTKNMDEFKRRFRSVDALLIDDIQFFAGKNTTQEEFFHTFNALFDGKQQIILTCDR
jgi:chromosomal replication initiator protein